MKMQEKQFRIGELAKHIGVEQFVIRFWEKEFGIKSYRSNGGQRFYVGKDVQTFKTIQRLLHEEGFTIAGAKQKLAHGTNTIPATQSTMINKALSKEVMKELKDIRKQLMQLKEMI